MMKTTTIIYLSFFMITVIYGQDTHLEQPICILDDYDDTKPTQEFKAFATYEECQFHLFMDKLEEIDCYLIHEYGQPKEYNCDQNQACLGAVFKVREEIYTYRVDNYTCKCNESRPTDPSDSDSNNQYSFMSDIAYDYFTADLKVEDTEEPENTIHTLCEYINCWISLWENMFKVVEKKLDEIRTNPEIEDCKKIGQKSSLRCPTNNKPPICTPVSQN